MVYKYAHAQLHKLPSKAYPYFYSFCLSSYVHVDCLTFFIHGPNSFCMLRINISVNAVAHCMLVKHADIYTRESRPKLHGNKLSVSQMSAVLTHHHLSKHTISDSDFTILTSGNSKFDLEMRESLLISN